MCPTWGDAVPQFLQAHPRAAGGERSPESQVSQWEMLCSPSQDSSASARRLLSPAGRRHFVKHGPEVLMSDEGTQHLPWPHPETMPRPTPGLLHKKRPLGGEASPRRPAARTAVSLVPGGAPGL